MKGYKLKLSTLVGCDSFLEASREELRVLLALIGTKDGSDADALARAAGVSGARVRSALVLWEEAGVIEKAEGEEAHTVTEEFEERITLGKISEISAEECARDIKNNDLVDLMAECATLMGKPALSTEEAKTVSAIYVQYSLAEEYILTLAAYLQEKHGRLSITRLGTEAERLVKAGVDTTAELEAYISDKARESAAEMEVKRVLGIYGRRISKTESALIKKWCQEFGYSAEIIDEAYDISVIGAKGELSLPYIDKILSSWHEAGCKTVEECLAYNERTRAERAAEGRKAPPRLPRTPKKKDETRFGDFDPEEALKLALARSYREDDDDEGDDDTEDKK